MRAAADGAPPRDVRFVRVLDASLRFGCMRAIDDGGSSATLLVYDRPNVCFARNLPAAGDCFLCERVHSSVFVPRLRFLRTHACLRHLDIPRDLLDEYFPVFLPA